MIIVAVTGTPGSGKSTFARLLEARGARRVDTDELARRAVQPGAPALQEIRREFGDGVIDGEGHLDRTALRAEVFSDPEARGRLEDILHPVILALLEERIATARRDGEEVVVVEVPLLFEKELQAPFDLVVAVDAPEEVRWNRISESRGLDRRTFEGMEAAQWPGERKRAAADLVVMNDGEEAALEARAREVWAILRERAGGAAGGETASASDGGGG